MNVAEIMTKRVFSVTPTTKVKELAALLRDKKIGGVPVIEEGKLAGIVTGADILTRKPGQNLVRNIMTTNVVTVTDSTRVREAARIVANKRITRLPVLSQGKVVGVVSAADIVKAVARSPKEPARAVGASRAGGAH